MEKLPLIFFNFQLPEDLFDGPGWEGIDQIYRLSIIIEGRDEWQKLSVLLFTYIKGAFSPLKGQINVRVVSAALRPGT